MKSIRPTYAAQRAAIRAQFPVHVRRWLPPIQTQDASASPVQTPPARSGNAVILLLRDTLTAAGVLALTILAGSRQIEMLLLLLFLSVTTGCVVTLTTLVLRRATQRGAR